MSKKSIKEFVKTKKTKKSRTGNERKCQSNQIWKNNIIEEPLSTLGYAERDMEEQCQQNDEPIVEDDDWLNEWMIEFWVIQIY